MNHSLSQRSSSLIFINCQEFYRRLWKILMKRNFTLSIFLIDLICRHYSWLLLEVEATSDLSSLLLIFSKGSRMIFIQEHVSNQNHYNSHLFNFFRKPKSRPWETRLWALLQSLVLCDHITDHILRHNSRNHMVIQPVQFLLLAIDLLWIQCLHMP